MLFDIYSPRVKNKYHQLSGIVRKLGSGLTERSWVHESPKCSVSCSKRFPGVIWTRDNVLKHQAQEIGKDLEEQRADIYRLWSEILEHSGLGQ